MRQWARARLARLVIGAAILTGCVAGVSTAPDQPPEGGSSIGEHAEKERPDVPGEGAFGGEEVQAESGDRSKTARDGGTREVTGVSGNVGESGGVSERSTLTLVAPAVPPTSLEALREELESLFSSVPGTFGMAVVDLVTGEEMAIQPERVFPAASTYKLPMAMFVLNEVAEGRASLNDLVEYKPEDWQDGSGVLQDIIKEGDKVSIRRLVELSITESDNIAAMMLRRHFRSEDFAAYRMRMGETQLYWWDEDGTVYYGATPRAMTRYLIALYRGEGISDPALVQYLLNLLCHTAWRDRIDGGVPDSVPVAHKVGTLDGVINDVGLILHPTRPYVMTFYSEGLENEEDGVALAEYASRRVYQYFSSVADIR